MTPVYSTKVNQKEAVFSAVMAVMKEHGIKYEEGKVVKSLLSRDHRAAINSILAQGFKSGKIELATPEILSDDSTLAEYVSGLQSNWLRKDTRLNGGEPYKATNPGSRAGTSDPQIQAMRQLLKTVTNPKERAEIEGYISRKQDEIAAAKVKASVNFNALPPELQRKYQARA